MVAVRRVIELNQLTVQMAEQMLTFETDPLLNLRYCAGHQTFHPTASFTRSQVISAPAARVCSKWFAVGRPFPKGVCHLSTDAKMAFAYSNNLEVKGLQPLTSHLDLNFLPQKSLPNAIKELIARIYSDEVKTVDDEGGGAGSSGAGPAITTGGLRTDHLGFTPHHGTRSEKQVLSR